MRSNYLISLSIFLLISIKVFSQPEKLVIENGNIEPIVQAIEKMPADVGFEKLNEWINYNYKNADAVLGSSIENKFIRFTGVNPGFASNSGYVYDLEYTVRVEFKDDKYRFTVDQLRSGHKGVFAEFLLSDYYKKDGEPRKSYKNFIDGIYTSLNELNASIYNYLTGVTEKVSDEW